MLDKGQLRQWIREQKQKSDPIQRRLQSENIIRTLLEHPRIKKARVILLYKALPDEVETQALLDNLAGTEKTVLLPVVIDSEILELRVYKDRANLREGAYHIQEPAGKPFFHYE